MIGVVDGYADSHNTSIDNVCTYEPLRYSLCFLQTLDYICKILPPTFSSWCLSAVAEYGEVIIEMLGTGIQHQL